MIKEDSMLNSAMSMFGSCMESEACESLVVSMLMKEYDVSEKEAGMMALLARAEWVEAYE